MKNFLASISFRYKNSSLQKKIFLIFFFVVLIPIVVLALFSYYSNSQVIKNQSLGLLDLYLTQTETALYKEISMMEQVSTSISFQSSIREILENDTDNLTFQEQFEDYRLIVNTLQNIQSTYHLSGIRLYVNSNRIYSNSKNFIFNLEDISQEEWYVYMIENFQAKAILNPYLYKPLLEDERLQITSVLIIRSLKNIQRVLGVVMIDLPVEALMGIIESADFTDKGIVLIIDKDKQIVCQYGDGDLLSDMEFSDIFNEASGASGNKMLYKGKKIAAGISSEICDSFRIFTAAPYKNALEEANILKNKTIFLLIITGIIIYIMTYLYSLSYTKRINQLSTQLKQVEKGNFDVKFMVDREDEIGDLQNSFNFMVSKLNVLMQEQYNLGIHIKELELKALQAQINPHFLYNTLDLISWKAKEIHSRQIEDIVYKLARYYQISLSNGSDFISIKNEIEHIRFFVDLQNMRLKHEIILHTHFDSELGAFPVMKFILQPIVENSITHGILNLDDRQGVIDISVVIKKERIIITVSDNGIGIRESTLKSILARKDIKEYNEKNGGFGLLNVIERLNIYYEEEAIFDIRSNNDGTTVTISIPMDKNRKEISLI